jgi:hypothetical protein
MEQPPSDTSDRSANSEFTFDPTNKIVGVIDDPTAATAALRDLRAAGFTADELEVLMGEEGAQRIDLTGEGPEASVHIVRSTQKPPTYYDAPVIVRRVEQETLAGHYLIGVVAKEPEARERARDILKAHGGHFINFYGRWAAEALEP